MKLLVTGGCGFIGSAYIRRRLRQNPEDVIVNLDVLTYSGNLANVAEIADSNRYHFVQSDIADADAVGRLFSEHSFDAVVNFAAETHVDRSILGPSVFVKTNIVGTHELLRAAREHQVPRYVQVSTDEVYGSLGAEGAFHETTPLSPRSPYSASKASADHMVDAYYHTYGLHTNITRCSNNYGPYQYPEKVLPLMVINALGDKPLPVYGDGLQRREWLFVDDHCAGIDAVLHQGRAGEVYNIGGVNELPNIEVIKGILAILSKSESLIRHVEDRPGHDRRYAIDSAKIRSELAWAPEVSFEKGLEQTVRWYVDNRAWWEPIVSGEYRQYYEKQYAARLAQAGGA